MSRFLIDIIDMLYMHIISFDIIYNIYIYYLYIYIYIYIYVYKREFKSCLEELENEMFCLEENKLV